MRAPMLLWGGFVLASCGSDSSSSRKKTSQTSQDTIEDDDGGVGGGSGFGGDGTGGDDGETQHEIGTDASPGDVAEGEAFQFVVNDLCDFVWAVEGAVVECADCPLAFEVELTLSDEGSCGDGEDVAGTLRVSDAAVYFQGTGSASESYWGTVFRAREGYLTWNSPAYDVAAPSDYYIGHVTY